MVTVIMTTSLQRVTIDKLGRLARIRNLLVLLCVWGLLTCVLYTFWGFFICSFPQHYMCNTAHAHVQREIRNAVSATGRAALPVKMKLQSRSRIFHDQPEYGSSPGLRSLLTPANLPTITETTSESNLHADTVVDKDIVTLATHLKERRTAMKNSTASNSKASWTQPSTTLPAFSSSFRNSSSSSSTWGGISNNESSSKLLCVHFTGRLGNELFQYASTLGLALTLNRTPVFLDSKILSTVLKDFVVSPANMGFSELQRRCNKARVMAEMSCCTYKKQMTQLDPRYDYLVATYLQSYRYFENHRTHIRKAVTFKDWIQTWAHKIVQGLRQKHRTSTLVGVHIRHGDMALEQNQKIGYPIATPDYINKSLSYFTRLNPHCVFVVASDSVLWCKNNFPKGYNVVFLSGNPPVVDMQILASLDHVITSFGSFSWWIGYLSRGRVVYMKDFIRANTLIGNTFYPKGRGYIYPGWIPL